MRVLPHLTSCAKGASQTTMRELSGAAARNARRIGAASIALGLAVGLAACGSGVKGSQAKGAGSQPAMATVVAAGPPDSLDPQVGETTAATEATWNVYLGLYSYAHRSGPAGTEVIPALADSLPKISAGGTLYTARLRPHLVYSNGRAVKAGDFAYTVERALKLNWPGKGFLIEHIVGAAAFDAGKAATISGIHTDDASGQITIKLTAPFGPFLDILAMPAMGFVPAGTPMKALPNDPPPGVGPYVIKDVIPGKSFEEIINPHWTPGAIAGIPTPQMNVTVEVQSNPGAQAADVLEGSADLFDWNTALPPAAAQQASREASDRYSVVPVSQVTYFFLNTSKPPFDNKLAREAVNSALNRPAFARLASGYLTPGCYLLPPDIVGHPHEPCPYGSATSTGNVGKAKQLVEQSGTAGDAVTVWGLAASPVKQFTESFAQMLRSIGYKVTDKIIAPSTYFPTVTTVKTGAQVGFAEYSQDFPNPVDFYQLIDGSTIHPEGNHDLSLARDPRIEREVRELGEVQASDLQSVQGRWEALERHTAKEAYMAVIGYQQAPQLTSSRIDFHALRFSPVYGPDWTTLKLK